MTNDFEDLKRLMREECDMVPSDDVLDSVLALGDVIEYDNDDVVTEAGEIAPYIYIVKEGILSISDMNGTKERTVAFACPGTICTNKHSFVKQLPSYYQIEACGRTVVVRIPRERFLKWIEQSHEGTVWFMHLWLEELYYLELNNATVHNGTGAERLISLHRHRPEILGKVMQKKLASYLGITPEYLCRVKKRFLKNQ